MSKKKYRENLGILLRTVYLGHTVGGIHKRKL